jgi:SAM-dependent methyltransferase
MSVSQEAATANDPYGGRIPTSHERDAGQPWDASYRDGPAPWDLGRPQQAVVRLASEGRFTGSVLDAGCGTGDNALHIATLGGPVFAFDVAETALAMARAKAADRGLDVEFATADAFDLARLHRTFDTVLDSGVFHAFDADERARYAASLATVTKANGTLFVLCFGDQGPELGPHPVAQEDLHAAFNERAGWRVIEIEPERIETRFHENGASAWLATVKRA